MILISLLIIIVAIALPSFKTQLTPILLTRITSLILIYSGALAFNALYIQSIGSGIGIYSGLFHVTIISQQLDIFLLTIGALILIARPGIIEYIKVVSTPSHKGDNTLNSLSSPLGGGAAPFLGIGGLDLVKKYNLQSRSPQSYNFSTSTNSSAAGLQQITTPSKIIYTELVSGLGDKYSLIILFSTLGSTLLLSSSDLLSMYLSIELQSFGVYILSTLFRDSRLATSAGLKYFLLGGLSSCLILLGSGLVYFYTGLTNLESIYSLISISNSQSITQGLSLGLIIIMIGFLFKIAAAPLHNWAPDVYDDSPTIVTIWLTIMPKIAILVFLLDLFIGGTSWTNNLSVQPLNGIIGYDALKNLLLLSSLFSLIIGTVVGLAQSRIKRLLAYSTISHIGFLLLALAINSEQSIDSFIFYIIQYSVTNLNTFLIILAFGYLNFFKKFHSDKNSFRYGAYSDNKNIENMDIRFITELKGQFMSNPLLSLSLAICLFSMAGIPPLMGFFSKQMVLYSAVQSGYYFMSIVAIIVSVISASYYLKIVRILFTPPQSGIESDPVMESVTYNSLNEKGDTTNHKGSLYYPLSANIPFVDVHENYYISYYITNFHSFLISTLTLSILFFILKPSLLLNSTQLLSLSLFYC
uniref:NADH-ubiquinone oxidoreductase chain 2 n=1 Tax=Coniferiporia sulphurascens TaxID=175648 RepID=A0A5B9RDC8_CONSH|nr:NADH dehydrogenase subunit 2 [Coniferiporia sulphurascens]QEG57180.1 NADH dehydrogenase subunit 2 [Coniferiporia sulphurascens]